MIFIKARDDESVQNYAAGFFLMACKTPCISSLFFLARSWDPILFLRNFKHLFSLPILSNSWALLSYGANPATSLIRSLTNLLCLVCFPLVLLGLALSVLAVVL